MVWLSLLVWLLPGWVLGQRIQLGEAQPLCAGATLPVSFTVNQPFEAGNTFRIEILNQAQQVVATTADNVLPTGATIRIPPSFAPTPVNYWLRIAATKPLTYSNDVPLTVNGVPSATLQPPADGSVNPGEPLRVGVILTGGGPFALRFTDGTTRDLDDLERATLLLYSDQSKTYQLASVTNRCGTGRVGGAATATVRAAGLLVTRLSTTEPCAGQPLDIFFSTDRTLPANNTFKVDFQPLTPQVTPFTLTGTGTSSPLRVVLPANIAVSGAYRVRLYSETDNLSAWYRDHTGDDASPVLVRNVPRVRLSGSAAIGFGQTAALTATVTGLGRGAVTLSDGTVVSVDAPNQDGSRALTVRPGQTNTYTVRSVSTGCGIYGPEAGSGSATVTVRPGYRIDSLSSQTVCAGQPVQVFFSTNEPIVADAGSYRFRGGTQIINNELGGGSIEFVGQSVTPGSQPNTGILTAVARPLPADYGTNAAYGSTSQLLAGWFYTQLSRNGNAGNVYDKPLAVADKPQLLLEQNPLLLNRPQMAFLPARLVSHASPTTVLLSDGTQVSVRGEIDFGQKSSTVLLEALASRSGTFGVAAVQNRCGTGTARGSVAVQVGGDTVALFMRPIPALLCANAPVSVSFTAVGDLGPVANYRVELSDENGVFGGRFLGSGTGSPIAVTIPAGGILYSRAQVRVVSSPASGTVVWQSAARAFTYLDATQVVRLSAAVTGRTETVIRAGETAQLRLFSGGNVPTTVVLSNGQTILSSVLSVDVPVRPAQTTTYTIRSVANACGVAAGTGTVTVRVQPFTVQPLLQKRTYCEGDSLVSHLLVEGELPAQATHALQVLLAGNVVQTLPARLSSNRLAASMPASLSAGTPYAVRVLTTMGTDQFYSLPTATTFRTYRFPRLQLTPPNNQTAVILDAKEASLTVQLTNPADPAATLLPSRYSYRINGQAYTTLDNVPASVPIYATSVTPASYSIAAVYDAYCGFGTATGAVRVSYRPGLRSLAIDKTRLCRGSDQAVITYEVAGDFPAETRFTVFLTDAAGVRTRVGESAKQADRLVIPIDSLLAPGTYQVSVTLPPSLPPYDQFPSVTIGDRPNVVIAGGNAVQYSDQTVSVGIRVLSGFLPVSMTLTNGLTQTLFAAENTLTFSPRQSTAYQIARVTNECGAGRAGGVVSVTVLPPQANEIRVATVGPQGVSGLCQGGSVQVGITPTGTFAADNRFVIYLSDSTGQNYRPLPTQTVDALTLIAALPADVLPGTGYRVRIGATNPAVLGAASGTFLTIRPGLRATISGSRNVSRGELVPVVFTLNNTGPWSVSLNHSIYGFETALIDKSPFLYQVRPDATTTYTLLGVSSGQCGSGQASGQVTFVVTDPLAIDPALPLTARPMPNPTAGRVRVAGTLPAPQVVTVRLTDAGGRVLQTHYPGLLRELSVDLDLSQYAAGTYLLTVEADDRRVVFKVVKQ